MYSLVSKVFTEKLLPLSKCFQASDKTMYIVNKHHKNLPLILHKVSGLIHAIIRLGYRSMQLLYVFQRKVRPNVKLLQTADYHL